MDNSSVIVPGSATALISLAGIGQPDLLWAHFGPVRVGTEDVE